MNWTRKPGCPMARRSISNERSPSVAKQYLRESVARKMQPFYEAFRPDNRCPWDSWKPSKDLA